ncbi:TPA: hypothetical protein ACL1SD_001188 [Pseudomonas aeruginosa]|uniref:hypothetical protein n=1 Tax=Pseudomonas aeruginosa TaxID=287 RepID=UPI000442F3E0|nr:hypothetical protein [Pseudomonas aeruginosa]AHW72822.1 hypothetical protein PA96_4343 [Pseudomonas aeruginosa PA96]MBH9243161.1 hypothetical protein [Pseudomonas aeruginosa]MBV5587365.1 hypothetical protein [Pseudomonas aeruginosa]MBX5597554.1 hypothetical protein [Pseudomonas aeruginosa]MDK6702042.1 hypothetical protein [Pseudomonas aeruginosa]
MSKVECQCCKRMMVPKIITSAPLYVSGVPLGGGDPESSVCPFCLSPKWMLTEHQALAAGRANAEFYGIMVLALINIVVFVRFGELTGGIALAASIAIVFMRTKVIRAVRRRLDR